MVELKQYVATCMELTDGISHLYKQHTMTGISCYQKEPVCVIQILVPTEVLHDAYIITKVSTEILVC